MFDYYFFVNDIIDSKDKTTSTKLLLELVMHKTCTFYIKGSNTIEQRYITSAEIYWYDERNTYQIYLNDYPIDKDAKVYVRENSTNKIAIGIPSGQILKLKCDELEELVLQRLIKFEFFYSCGDINLKDSYFFKDDNIKNINEFLEWSKVKRSLLLLPDLVN